MGCWRQLLERVDQKDAQNASAFRNDMETWDGLHEHAYGSVMRRLENSAEYDRLIDDRKEAIIKDFDGLVAGDMCVRFEQVRRCYTKPVFRDGFIRTHLDVRRWRMSVIYQDLDIISTFKNGVFQKLENMEKKCPVLDGRGFYGRGIEIYDTFGVSQGIHPPLLPLEKKLSQAFEHRVWVQRTMVGMMY